MNSYKRTNLKDKFSGNPLQRNALLLAVMLIFILGFSMRIFGLGAEAFWNDEAGQVLVATSPTIKTLIAGTAAHAMAMPLDYIVTRILARFSLDPTVLRLPSVVWSSSTILIIAWYSSLIFANERHRKFMVLFSAMLTAITPIYIYYAQEVRFYAAMSAFYWITSACILNYLATPKFRNWVFVLISMLAGVFFHPFVLFAAVNLLFIFLHQNRPLLLTLKLKQKEILMIITVFVISFLACLLWIMMANLRTSDKVDPFGIAKNLFSFVLQGFNLMFVQFCSDTKLFSLWEIFLGVLLIFSIAAHLRRDEWKWTGLLFFTVFSQIAVIAAANIYRSYWIVYRQIIYLIPYLYMFISKGLANLIDKLQLGENKTKQRVLFSFLILVTLFAVTGRLQEIYQSGKSNADEVTKAILELPDRPEVVLVDPGYEVKVYQLYLRKLHHFDNMEILPFSKDLAGTGQGSRALILSGPIDERLLGVKEYSEVLIPQRRCAGNRFVYLLKD